MQEEDPWAEVAIPPEWVPIRDVPDWIERRFGIPGSSIIHDLINDLRVVEIRYRVSGFVGYSGLGSDSHYPPWLRSIKVHSTIISNDIFDDDYDVIVRDWDAACFDKNTGTVAGFPIRGEELSNQELERHVVVLFWPSVEKWVKNRFFGSSPKTKQKVSNKIGASYQKNNQFLENANDDSVVINEPTQKNSSKPFNVLTEIVKPIKNRPGGGGKKMENAIEAMVCSVKEGKLSFHDLQSMKQEVLSELYPEAGRTLLVRARNAALEQLATEGFCNITPTKLRQKT